MAALRRHHLVRFSAHYYGIELLVQRGEVDARIWYDPVVLPAWSGDETIKAHRYLVAQAPAHRMSAVIMNAYHFIGRDSNRSRTLPERKTKRFYSRVGKLYFELSISNRFLLTHELVRPLTSCRPVPLIIDVGSVRCTGRLAVDLYCEPHRLRSRRRAHYEIHVAGVEAIHDATIRLVQYNGLSIHRPI